MFQILQYISFLFRSKNQHGVHSPFVYDLITKCFYDTSYYENYKELSKYRTALLKNNRNIEITDLGAGSRVFKSNTRTIKSIAKASGTTKQRAQLLYRLVTYLKPNSTLELGTSLGIATHAMALNNVTNKVTSIEGCPNLSEFTSKQLADFNISNVTIKTGDISNLISQLNLQSFDIIFFDANHNETATLNYFNSLIEHAQNDSVFIFDDIYWSKGMKSAWETIKMNPKVTVTIDTFFWGFVFFRKEQAKENFTIRL